MSDRPALVAVPGLGLDAADWRAPFAALESAGAGPAQVRLLPGYGVAFTGPAATPATLAQELLAGLTGPTILLGHSASCQVVAHAARSAPDLVRGLVLVGPTTDPRARSWAGLMRLWLRTAGHEDPRQLPSLVRQYHRTTVRSMLRTMDAARRDDIVTTLRAVPCPVLLVRGRRDRIARRDWLDTLAATGADRTVVELPAGAHMVPITHPRLLARHLLPALTTPSGPRQ